MSPTQTLLRRHLALVFGISALAVSGCDRNRDRLYTVVVGVDEECPSVEEVNEQYMPDVRCGGILYRRVLELEGREPWEYWYYDSASDTGAEGPDYYACQYSSISRESIRGSNCIEGRPLIEAGEARVASVRGSARPGPWMSGDSPLVVDLSEGQRRLLRDFWLRSALYEHASIPSFNRFSMELVRFGAPPALVVAAQQAAIDEVRHAQRCFTLASAYAGEHLGPGPLSAQGEAAADLVEFATRVAREAAINETLAVLQAAEQLAGARDPAVRSLLQQIIDDEARHAELAWSTLRWALKAGGAPVRAALTQLAGELRAPSLSGHPEQGVAAHGLPDRAPLRAALQAGVDRVLVPAFQSLLG